MDTRLTSHHVTTTLCDLNDDCLLEVFEHLDKWDLCAVGDVCSRFRENAKITFVHSDHSRLTTTNIHRVKEPQTHILLLEVSKMLRLFGRFIRNLESAAYPFHLKFECDENWIRKYHQGVVELLIKYCSGNLKMLDLREKYSSSDETILEMRPLLEGLQTLHYFGPSKLLLKMLPLCCTELQRLQLFNIPSLNCEEKTFRFSGLRKSVEISFGRVHDVSNDDVEELMKWNPQLQVISLYNCPKIDDRSIFQVIAEHGVRVEDLTIDMDWENEAKFDLNTKYFDRLNNLKHLKVDFRWRISNVESFICEIAAHHAALIDLELGFFHMRRPDRFVQGIRNLKNLKKLHLKIVRGLTVIDICSICKYLYNVRLNGDVGLTGEDLLRLLGSAENLNSLTIDKLDPGDHWRIINPIDVDVFEEMVKLVEGRSKETHLEIRLHSIAHTIRLPDELARAHKKTMTLKYL